jgi:hypothetical protein
VDGVKNKDVEKWLLFSQTLSSDLMPKDIWPEMSGMDKGAFAALVDREADRVNEALIAMALADGESTVKLIFSSLDRDTVIALCSRWMHYYSEWMKMLSEPEPHLWIPPGEKDLWRAIFLAMTDDSPAASAACMLLWPEESGERLD